jgi:hypothetical protein
MQAQRHKSFFIQVQAARRESLLFTCLSCIHVFFTQGAKIPPSFPSGPHPQVSNPLTFCYWALDVLLYHKGLPYGIATCLTPTLNRWRSAGEVTSWWHSCPRASWLVPTHRPWVVLLPCFRAKPGGHWILLHYSQGDGDCHAVPRVDTSSYAGNTWNGSIEVQNWAPGWSYRAMWLQPFFPPGAKQKIGTVWPDPRPVNILAIHVFPLSAACCAWNRELDRDSLPPFL